jgi:hypothetical protein
VQPRSTNQRSADRWRLVSDLLPRVRGAQAGHRCEILEFVEKRYRRPKSCAGAAPYVAQRKTRSGCIRTSSAMPWDAEQPRVFRCGLRDPRGRRRAEPGLLLATGVSSAGLSCSNPTDEHALGPFSGSGVAGPL